jgi:TolA-binding protein
MSEHSADAAQQERPSAAAGAVEPGVRDQPPSAVADDRHVATEPAAASPAAPDAITVDELPIADDEASATNAASMRPPRSNTQGAAGDTLSRELRLIESARSALAGKDATEALHRLDAYKRQFPKGSLATEALMLRIESLVVRGDHSAAGRLGDALLERSPNGPYARRVRSLLGRSNSEGLARP